MARQRFDQELLRLKETSLMVGQEVETNIMKAVTAFVSQDSRQIEAIINADEWVNRRQVQLSQDALTVIATQQPVARDMRFVIGLMGIMGELERIHDYLKDVCIIGQQIKPFGLPKELMVNFPEIGEITSAMVHSAMTAFENHNVEQARAVPAGDQKVEALYYQTYRLLVQFAAEHSEKIDAVNRLQWATHNMARIADKTINICEWVIYIMTGDMIEIEARHYPPLVN